MRLTREQLEAIRNKDWTRYHMVPLSCIDSLIEHINVLEADITTHKAETAAMLEKAATDAEDQNKIPRSKGIAKRIRALIHTDYADALEERLNEARAEARKEEHIRSCQRCVCCEKCKFECSRLRELNRLATSGGEGRSE